MKTIKTSELIIKIFVIESVKLVFWIALTWYIFVPMAEWIWYRVDASYGGFIALSVVTFAILLTAVIPLIVYGMVRTVYQKYSIQRKQQNEN
jgi:predicted ferric reductase